MTSCIEEDFKVKILSRANFWLQNVKISEQIWDTVHTFEIALKQMFLSLNLEILNKGWFNLNLFSFLCGNADGTSVTVHQEQFSHLQGIDWGHMVGQSSHPLSPGTWLLSLICTFGTQAHLGRQGNHLTVHSCDLPQFWWPLCAPQPCAPSKWQLNS